MLHLEFPRRSSASLFVAVSLLLLPGPVISQPAPSPCGTEAITINTGHAASAVLPVGAGDPGWTVVSDPDPLTTEPRPAFVINPNAAWKPAEPSSRWLSSYPGSANITNGKYVFRYCFCLAARFERPVLNVALRADDQANVLLNGTLIGSTPNPAFGIPVPFAVPAPPASRFVAGRNCLTVELNNTGSVAMGLNLVGSVTAQGLAVQRPECCDPTGQIQGKKWDDANGNGVQDAGEPALAGWTITLSNGMTAVTDVHGYYYFFGVAPGSYTLSEVGQPGWQQTSPAGGAHQVSVVANQVLAGKDFGNRRGESDIPLCSLCGEISGACCLGVDAQGRKIYSFLIPVNYQSFGPPPGTCALTLTAPSGTILSYGPTVLNPGANLVSGTLAISGAAASPFCLKMKCGTSGPESCLAPVCIKALPPCGQTR